MCWSVEGAKGHIGPGSGEAHAPCLTRTARPALPPPCTLTCRSPPAVRPAAAPHTEGDGENVFVLSVDAPSVLTLSPVRWYRLTRLLGWLGADEREQVGAAVRGREGAWRGMVLMTWAWHAVFGRVHGWVLHS